MWASGKKQNGAVAFASRCRAYRSGTQLIVKDAEDKVEFNAEQYDENNEFDITTNHRWTCKEAGEYHIDAGVTIDPVDDAETAWIYIKLNGTTNIISNEDRPGIGGHISSHVSGDYHFEVDDYIEVFLFHTNSTDRNTYHATGDPYFNIHRIG